MSTVGQAIRRFNGWVARHIAPRTVENLEYIATTRKDAENVMARLADFEENLAALAAELNEIRRDERRMAELYDLVFAYVRDTSGATTPKLNDSGSAPRG